VLDFERVDGVWRAAMMAEMSKKMLEGEILKLNQVALTGCDT